MFCEISLCTSLIFNRAQTLKSETDFTAVSSSINELPGKAGSRFALSLFWSYLRSNWSCLPADPRPSTILRRLCHSSPEVYRDSLEALIMETIVHF